MIPFQFTAAASSAAAESKPELLTRSSRLSLATLTKVSNPKPTLSISGFAALNATTSGRSRANFAPSPLSGRKVVPSSRTRALS